MWRDHAFKRLSGSASYSRKELMQIFRKEKADLDDTAFRWALYGMLYSHKLFRIGYDSYATDKPPVLAEYIPSYSDKAKRLEKLINEFFEITRYNLQGIVLEKETIDLYYMLVQMTDEFYPLLQAHQNTTELDVDEEMTIYGDAENLARVFNNILKNAVAYSYPGTAIKISAKQTDTEVQICFQNKGKTIPAHKLESIFEKFFRLDESRSSNTGGAGLGRS